MTVTVSPLECAPGVDSLCFRCRYYDWAITTVGWEHICNSPIECTPGDAVIECVGYINGDDI